MKLRNAPVIAWNLAGVTARRAAHWLAVQGRAVRGAGKRAQRSVDQVAGGGAAVAAAGVAGRRAAKRWARRAERIEEHVIAPLREERRVLGRIREIARAQGPILVGPWVSEVGYEVLYWLPFLRWFQDRYGISPGRMVAVSRGGVEWWYQPVAGRYIDLLDVYTADEFARQGEARRSAGDQKQLEPSEWEQQIVRDIRGRAGVPDAHLLHPGLMYRLFRNVWHGDRGLDFLFRHTAYEPPPVAPRAAGDDWLPQTFAAVKFYTGPALPDTPETRARLRAAVASVAERMPVVSLDTGLGLDEHRDYLFDGIPNVMDLRDRMTPATNLAVQSRVIARASLFVGTCGSLAWLAPMLGVPTVAVYADDRYLSAHLYAARYAFRRMRAARFSVVDLKALTHVA